MKDFTEQDYQQIDRYLQGYLSDTERLAFEERLLREPDLAEEVQWVQKLHVNYEHVGIQKKVGDIHRELTQQGVLATQPVFWTAWRMAMAASVILVLGVGVWYWQKQPSFPQLTVAVESPNTKPTLPTNTPDTVSIPVPDEQPTVSADQLARNALGRRPKGTGPVPAELGSSVADYERGRLKQAIADLNKPVPPAANPDEDPQFGSTKEPTPERTETTRYRRLYLGLSYLKNNQPSLALDQLNRVTQPPLNQTAEWYKALCYIQLNQTAPAKRLLDHIRAKRNHPYQAEAEELATALAAQTT